MGYAVCMSVNVLFWWGFQKEALIFFEKIFPKCLASSKICCIFASSNKDKNHHDMLRINTGSTKNTVDRTDNIKSFAGSLLKSDPLDKDKENQMFKEYILTKNEALRDTIIRSNAKFVFSAAKAFSNDPEEVLDLAMEGLMGMLDAFDRFDPETGNHFLSFANHYIYKYMVNYVHNNKMVRRSKDPLLRGKTTRIKDKFFAEHGRYPNADEIVELIEKVYHIKVNKKEHIEDISFKRLDDVYDGMDDGVDSFIESPDFVRNESCSHTNSYMEKIETEDRHKKASYFLNVLSERDRAIIKMLFGIDRDCPVSPEDVAIAFDMTTARVNQIKKESIKKMRDAQYKLAV
jgi:RNA polymerase primary sigma factor